MTPSRVPRTMVLILSVAITLAVVAACSSSGTSSESTDPTSGKPVVRILGIGIKTDPALGALFTPATYVETEPQLAAKYVNADASSKVSLSYTFCDTKATPAGSIACARKAAQSNACDGHPCDVVLNTADIQDNQSVPLIGKEGLPIVSATTSTTDAANTANNFGITVGLQGVQSGLGYVTKTLGAHKVGIMSLRRPNVDEFNTAMSDAVEAQGLQVAGTRILDSTTVAPNASIDAVMSGGADGLIDTAVGNVGAALKYAKQTYPDVKIAMPVFMISKSFFNGLPNSVTDGIGVTSWVQPTTATTVPGIAEFIKEGGLDAASGPYRGSDFATVMWLATRFIGNVANTISGSISKDTMLKALQTAKNIDMLGIVPPWNASERGKAGAEAHTPYNVVVTSTLKNQEEVASNPGVFVDAGTGKVAYVDPGFKAPAGG